jgi:acyl transferase domain-containing protein
MAASVGVDGMSPWLKDLASLTIACHKSPESLTISRDANEVHFLKERLESQSIFARVLRTYGNAYPPARTKKSGERYEGELSDMLSQLSPKDRVPGNYWVDFFPKVYADLPNKVLDARYWRRNLESPVRFSQGLSKLAETVPLEYLVEIGPHSAPQGPSTRKWGPARGRKFADSESDQE